MKLTKVGKRFLHELRGDKRYIAMCGGTRSGKTFSIIQCLIIRQVNAMKRKEQARIISIVSETYPHLRRGAIRDFKTIMEAEGLWSEACWKETTSTYVWQNGTAFEFFSADNAGKVHGASRDDIFINECQNIKYEIARQLFVRTRHRVFYDYNPTRSFWANEKIEVQERCSTIHSTYQDNEFLTQEQVAEIESNKGDANWWKVYGEGKIGTLEGLIYDFEQVDELPEHLPRVYGLDFGYHDPTCLAELAVDKDKKEVYIDEVLYRSGLLNEDLQEHFERIGVSKDTVIYGDCADVKAIGSIRKAGYNIRDCNKKLKKTPQILWCKGWKIFVTKRSVNGIKEMRNYTWEKKNDEFTDTPIDGYDHFCDAWRYGLYSEYAQRQVNFRYS